MSEFDITSKTMDGMGPHGTKVGLLRVLGPAHVWALGVGIVLVGEYMGWNFAVGKGGAYAALIACWFAGILYTCVAMIDSGGDLDRRRRRGPVYPGQAHRRPADGLQRRALPGLRLYDAGGGQRDHRRLSDFGRGHGMTGYEGELDQRPFIILSSCSWPG
jgi:ethanolamine permease